MGYFILLFIFLLCFGFWCWLRSRLRGIPGPFGLPIVGYIPFIGPRMNKTFAQLSQEYGPVFQVQIGSRRCVIVCGQKAIREATTGAKGLDFAARPDFKFYQGFGKFGEAGYYPYQRVYKKLTLQAMDLFAKHRKTDLQEIAQQAIELLLEDLKSYKGKPVDPKEVLYRCVWRVMGFICYGPSFDINDPEVSEIQRLSPQLSRAITYGVLYDFMTWTKWIAGSKLREYRKLMKLISELSKKLARKNFQSWDGQSTRTVADLFAKAGAELREEEHVYISDEELLDILTSLFGAGFASVGAGFATVAASVRWSLFWMAKHPEIQVKLHEELDSILSPTELPTFDDQVRLPFCTAVNAESYRMSSMSAMGIAHATTKDTTLNGFDIPSGTPVLFNLYSAHYDSTVFENPYQFDPYRFYDPETRQLKKEALERIMPYGNGVRRCGGESVAKMEIFLFFISIMHQCQVEAAPGEKLDPEDYVCALGTSLNPFKLCFKSRQGLW